MHYTISFGSRVNNFDNEAELLSTYGRRVRFPDESPPLQRYPRQLEEDDLEEDEEGYIDYIDYSSERKPSLE